MPKLLRLIIAACILALLGGQFGSPTGPVKAQELVEFGEVKLTVTYQKSIEISAVIRSQASLAEVYLTIKPQGMDKISLPVPFGADGTVNYTVDLNEFPIRTFSRVAFSFQVLPAGGEYVNSPVYYVDYIDQRFDWQQIERPPFSIFMYERDVAFSQAVENALDASLKSIARYLPETFSQPVRIYIYTDYADMKDALASDSPWIAGQSILDLGVVLISIPPGPEEKLELERQLPHELTHMLLYQVTGERYANQPAWLVEGLASSAELYPNVDYERVLGTSAQNGELIPFENLCVSFPKDASGAFLAYAQSNSFVQFIIQSSGINNLRTLINQYAAGLGCVDGVEAALGSPLSEFELRWKLEALNLQQNRLVLGNLMPYLLLFGLVFGAAAAGILLISRSTKPSLPTRSENQE